MKDFLSNIDIGVFDLDQVLKDGFSSIVPPRFRNQAKQNEKQYQQLVSQRKRLIKMAKDATDKQKVAIRNKLKELDAPKKAEETQRAILERRLRGQTLGGRLQNFSTTGIGRTAIGLGGVAVRSIQKTFSNISQTVDETGMFSSKLLQDFDQIGEASRNILMNNERLYNSVDDNFETFIKFRREFGDTEQISVKLLDNISQMENIIGLSNEDAIALLSTFRGINRMSAETNTALIQSASMLSSANNVAFRDVMQDITDNAEFFATYMATSSDDVAEMVVRSRRLGVEFGTFAKIFDSFSGIEGTLETQARTSIFSNKRMDFLGVLENLQAGNVQEAMSSIMDQIGGISQGRFDNPFVKKQLSEGFGVDVQTLGRLRREATGEMTVDDELKKAIVNFNENFKQLGFGTLKKDLTQFIINPLSNLFKNNTEEIQSIFTALGQLIKGVGAFTTFLGKSYVSLINLVKKLGGSQGETAGALTSLAVIGGSLYGAYKISNMLEGKQVALLGRISTQISGISGAKSVAGGGTGFMAGNVGKGLKGAGAGALIGGFMGSQDSVRGSFDPVGLGTSILTGGASGAMLGGPWGALAGAVLSGTSYLASDYFSDTDEGSTQKMNRGGIFKKRYTGKFDVAEAGRPEGFVPLETQDGKPTMPVNLSDDTIRRLAGAMSKVKLTSNVTVKGGKGNKMSEFYSQVMQPSSPLNV